MRAKRISRVVPFAAPLLWAVSTATAAIDFTLRHSQLPADGTDMDAVYISDGQSQIYLRVPPNWRGANNAQTLELTTESAGALVRLEEFPGAKVLTIDQAGGKELIEQVRAQLPKDAQKTEALPVELNPLPIFGWQTMTVGFRYEYFGQVLRRNVMYLNMIKGRVLQMTIVAPDADFEKIYKEARRFLSSWFEPSRDLPPDVRAKYEARSVGS